MQKKRFGLREQTEPFFLEGWGLAGYGNLLAVDYVDAAVVDGYGGLGAGLDYELLEQTAGYGVNGHDCGLGHSVLNHYGHVLAVDVQTTLYGYFNKRIGVTQVADEDCICAGTSSALSLTGRSRCQVCAERYGLCTLGVYKAVAATIEHVCVYGLCLVVGRVNVVIVVGALGGILLVCNAYCSTGIG